MIENQTRVIGILKFSIEDNLLGLIWIWIKAHFPCECLSTYFG